MLQVLFRILLPGFSLAVAGFAAYPKAYFSQWTGPVAVVSASQNKTASKIPRAAGSAPVISRNGKVLVELNGDFMMIIDTASKQILRTIQLEFTPNPSAAITSDGATVFAVTGTSIAFFDVASGVMIKSVSLPNSLNASVFLALSPDDQTIYTLYGNGPQSLCAIIVATASIRACLPVKSYNSEIFTRAMTVSADGARVYAFSFTTDLGEFDSGTLALLRNMRIADFSSAVDSLVYSRPQNAVYVSTYNYGNLTGNVYRVDLAKFAITAQHGLPAEPLDIAVTPDGNEVYIAGRGYPFGVYEGTTLAQTGTVNVGPTFGVVCGPY